MKQHSSKNQIFYFCYQQTDILTNSTKRSQSNIGSLKHFDRKNSQELRSECPWLYQDNDELRVYVCNQDIRPPYRLINGSCNFLSGFLTYDILHIITRLSFSYKFLAHQQFELQVLDQIIKITLEKDRLMKQAKYFDM